MLPEPTMREKVLTSARELLCATFDFGSLRIASSAHLGVLRSEFFSGGGFVVFYWGFWQKRVAERSVFVVNLWWNAW
jgi:hypothetical protein